MLTRAGWNVCSVLGRGHRKEGCLNVKRSDWIQFSDCASERSSVKATGQAERRGWRVTAPDARLFGLLPWERAAKRATSAPTAHERISTGRAHPKGDPAESRAKWMRVVGLMATSTTLCYQKCSGAESNMQRSFGTESLFESKCSLNRSINRSINRGINRRINRSINRTISREKFKQEK